jgi:hypothetical protein
LNILHEYLMQHSLKLGGTNYHFKWVKAPSTTPFWKAWYRYFELVVKKYIRPYIFFWLAVTGSTHKNHSYPQILSEISTNNLLCHKAGFFGYSLAYSWRKMILVIRFWFNVYCFTISCVTMALCTTKCM